jgi:predicted transcriptional regulator
MSKPNPRNVCVRVSPEIAQKIKELADRRYPGDVRGLDMVMDDALEWQCHRWERRDAGAILGGLVLALDGECPLAQ